ncbi:MAG: 1-(5-phosphoribosyl)-5-[(5-phosphoribosylamino)methylideneamino]imidazole-4-carboxamide isomerase [Woeseia sp.]
MKIIPAIDLQAGKCVRLFQGDFEKRTDYGNDPAAVAREYRAMGFKDLHVVDLDGARCGKQKNRGCVAAIASETPLVMQLGGGIRDRQTASAWFTAGVARCVIGSLAVTDPATVRRWLCEFGPDRLVLALDVRVDDYDSPTLVTHGWTRTGGIDLWQCLEGYLAHGIRHVLCTDVGRDGAMGGPNLALYRELVARYPEICLQVSGGVRHAADLRELDDLGAAAAISGRALLDGKIKSEELEPFLRVA